MKSILFIITSLHGGGAEKALLNLISNLDIQKYQVRVLTIFAEKRHIKTKMVEQVCLFSSNRSLVYRCSKYMYQKFGINWFLRKLIRYKEKNQYDIIVSFLEGDSLLFHSFLFEQAGRNISWVHTDFIMNHWSIRHFYKQDELIVYNRLNAIGFVSKIAQTQFNQLYTVSPTVSQFVCPNIIDIDGIIQLSKDKIELKKKRFTICSVGRLEEVKGYDLLIKSAKILQQEEYVFDLWIIGEGTQRVQLSNMIEEFHMQDNIHLLGYKENPYPYMSVSDLYISTSYAEGLPLVLCEAQCLSLPIIATRTIGAMKILADGRYGVLTDFDENDIAKKIQDVYEQEELRKRLIRQSQKQCQQFDDNNQYVISFVDKIFEGDFHTLI